MQILIITSKTCVDKHTAVNKCHYPVSQHEIHRKTAGPKKKTKRGIQKKTDKQRYNKRRKDALQTNSQREAGRQRDEQIERINKENTQDKFILIFSHTRCRFNIFFTLNFY